MEKTLDVFLVASFIFISYFFLCRYPSLLTPRLSFLQGSFRQAATFVAFHLPRQAGLWAEGVFSNPIRLPPSLPPGGLVATTDPSTIQTVNFGGRWFLFPVAREY